MRVGTGRIAVAMACVVFPALEAAAGRMSPVAPRCLGNARTLTVDFEKDEDRCVTRAEPTCPEGTSLKPDAEKKADRCAAEGDAKLQKPKCSLRLKLVEKDGADTCELIENPACPSSFGLKRREGPDVCNP